MRIEALVLKLIMPSIVLFFLFFMSCNGVADKRDDLSMIPDSLNGVLPISNWYAIGPFLYDSLTQQADESFLNADLTQLGFREDGFGLEEAMQVMQDSLYTFEISEPGGRLDFKAYMQQFSQSLNELSNVYLFTILDAPRDEVINLVTDGARHYKLWLNEEPLLHVEKKKNTLKTCDRFVRIKLRKGKNLLFVKLGRGSNVKSWRFISHLMNDESASEYYFENYNSDFVNNPEANDTLSIYLGHHQEGIFTIRNTSENLVLGMYQIEGDRTTIHLNDFEEGYYKGELIVKSDTLKELFFIGDHLSYLDSVERLTTTNIQLELMKRRLQYVNEVDNDKSIWERKIYSKNRVYYGKSWSDLLSSGKDYVREYAFFDEYQNSSGNKETFLIFIPTDSVGKLYDLALALPHATKSTDIVLSWYVGNLVTLQNDMRNASINNKILVYPLFGGVNYDYSKVDEDFRLLVKHLRAKYEGLVSDKTYLIGGCEGGLRALLLAQEVAEDISGLALSCPVTLSGPEKDRIPIDHICKLKEIPIHVRHMRNDLKTGFVNTYALQQEGQKCEVSISVLEDRGYYELGLDQYKHGFEFLSTLGN